MNSLLTAIFALWCIAAIIAEGKQVARDDRERAQRAGTGKR